MRYRETCPPRQSLRGIGAEAPRTERQLGSDKTLGCTGGFRRYGVRSALWSCQAHQPRRARDSFNFGGVLASDRQGHDLLVDSADQSGETHAQADDVGQQGGALDAAVSGFVLDEFGDRHRKPDGLVPAVGVGGEIVGAAGSFEQDGLGEVAHQIGPTVVEADEVGEVGREVEVVVAGSGFGCFAHGQGQGGGHGCAFTKGRPTPV